MKKVFFALTILSILGLYSCSSYQHQRSTTTTYGKENPVKREYTKCDSCKGLGSCTSCKGTGKISGNACAVCKGSGRCLKCDGKGIL